MSNSESSREFLERIDRGERVTPGSYQFSLPITDEYTLAAFLLICFGVRLPDVKVCDNHSTPWAAFKNAYFGLTPVTVIEGSRGYSGKSHMMSVLGMTEAITRGVDVNILGGSAIQSERVLETMTKLWDFPNAPKYLLSSTPGARKTRLTNGAKIQALGASQAAVRGPHPNKLLLDEIDVMSLPILDAAMGQPMPQRDFLPHIVMASTHQYPDGTMTEIKRRAAANGWYFGKWCLTGDAMVSTENGASRICDITPGMNVYAHCDGKIILTPVVNSWCSGMRNDILEVVTDVGTIRCTSDHRILTDGGWIEAGSLREGSIVCVMRREPVSVRRRKRLQKMRSRRSGVSLPRVRKKEASKIKNLHEVFQIEADKDEHSESGNAVLGQGESFSGIEKEPGEAGAKGKVTYRNVGDEGFARKRRGRIPEVELGLRFWENSRGSERKILARTQASRSTEKRQGKIDSINECRIQSADIMGRRDAFVDHAIVRAIRCANAEPVYDIEVRDGESFVANGIIVHNCYKESAAKPHGWLDMSIVDAHRRIVPAHMWASEYDLMEPSFEGRAIDTEKVNLCFDQSLGIKQGGPGEYIEIEKPMHGAIYATGADWAKENDWTVIVTMRVDTKPFKIVAFVRVNKRPWPDMVSLLDERVKRYPGYACHDATGVGNVVKDLLEVRVEPVVLSKRTRSELLSEYVSAIESGSFRSPRIEWMYKEHLYATRDDLVGAGHCPDSIIAGAMALRASRRGRKITWLSA